MVAIFNTIEIFNQIKDLGVLPSGVSINEPAISADSRVASSYWFTEEDRAYLLSFEGVELFEGLPSDWRWPDNGL